ncbi:phosphoribulokinase [Sediminicurvatus halobius]|uniref:Phosphoribulokinase n=1 Tax=Sediminicurvatus halobius TaxID=2182432 RepID=A0A2U2N436_9GAMM|nr:phosphoribulokinase [Spiribacter halobius]PWG63860.1 phosphoribulokinase [Spiribacter halobius]UEX76263.1 phosphoribulokinase [Spiribacter halobius]
MERNPGRPADTAQRRDDLRGLLREAGRPIVVAVAGDSGSGKTTYTQGIERLLGSDVVSQISLDGYHKEDRAQRRRSGRSPLDPRANHLPQAVDHLARLRRGETVEVPVYDHETGTFAAPRRHRPTPVIIVEGLHTLYPEFLPFVDFRLYVDSDDDVKWQWKLDRDVSERGYEPAEARRQMELRQADYRRWIDFQKANADVIVRIHQSELAALAVEELKARVPETCYHMEIIVTPTEVPQPSLYMPVDMNNMTRQQAMPFMIATVPSSFWGRPVNVVHVDGRMPMDALRQLEDEILNLAGLPAPAATAREREALPSTILFTQLLVAWPFLGHVSALLRQWSEEAATRANA